MPDHGPTPPPASTPGALSRRAFLARAGGVGLGAILLQLPAALRGKGWLDEAAAQNIDLTHDTISGLIAFAVPGGDRYSIAQGQTSTTPGGLDARAADSAIVFLDSYVPVPPLGPFNNGGTVPLSGAVANMLNAMAAQVDPVAAGGVFPSHFSRLSFAKKVEVFRRLDGTEGDDDLAHAIRYVAGVLPTLAAFCSYTDWHAFDPQTRTLRHRPVGWDLTNYHAGRTAPADGWPDLRGYYKGRKKAGR